MIHSRKFVAAAILLGLALVIAGLLVVPFNGSARAAPASLTRPLPTASGQLSPRLPTWRRMPPFPLPRRAFEGRPRDFSARCAGAVWPNIDTSCLSRMDGSPAPRVRTITIGYQAEREHNRAGSGPDGRDGEALSPRAPEVTQPACAP